MYTVFSLDQHSRVLRFQGKEITLSPRELDILRALLERPGTPVSRRQLRERLYGENESRVVGNPVQVHIHNLRAKLGEDVIRTVRGLGYVVEKPSAVPPPAETARPDPLGVKL